MKSALEMDPVQGERLLAEIRAEIRRRLTTPLTPQELVTGVRSVIACQSDDVHWALAGIDTERVDLDRIVLAD